MPRACFHALLLEYRVSSPPHLHKHVVLAKVRHVVGAKINLTTLDHVERFRGQHGSAHEDRARAHPLGLARDEEVQRLVEDKLRSGEQLLKRRV